MLDSKNKSMIHTVTIQWPFHILTYYMDCDWSGDYECSYVIKEGSQLFNHWGANYPRPCNSKLSFSASSNSWVLNSNILTSQAPLFIHNLSISHCKTYFLHTTDFQEKFISLQNNQYLELSKSTTTVHNAGTHWWYWGK